MDIQIVDPTGIPDWDMRLLQTREIDFFHSSPWAKVLKESYGYQPLYLTSHKNGRLALSVPLMEVNSMWTGKRAVSLPFSDHCIPFFFDRQILREAVDICLDHGKRAGWQYIEWRAADYFDDIPPSWNAFFVHEITLAHDDEELFRRLRSSHRRNIRRAAQEGLTISIGVSRSDLTAFRRLNNLTRKRHGLPPQPARFFESFYKHVLLPGHGLIVSAIHHQKVIASSIYCQFGKRAVFKYGASELGYLHLRPNNLIMWEAMRWYRDRNFEIMNLGRTELDNPGLLRYKRAWGAQERLVRYYRFDIEKSKFLTLRSEEAYRRIFSRMPIGILRIIGRIGYRHMG